MTEREKILARIREALKVPAPRPGSHGHGEVHAVPAAPASGARDWLPWVGESYDEQLARFRVNATDLKAQFCCVANLEELNECVGDLRAREGWKTAAAHHGVLTDAVCVALALPVCWTDQGYDARQLEKCDVGITECDALVAQTGSVLVTSRSAGGRALSVLPPHHVVLARRNQLLRDLPAAFELLGEKYGSNYPSMISFITGPSRTGDIERILVLGAHGPKQLTIFML